MSATNIRDKLDGNELDLSFMSYKEVPLKEIVSDATIVGLILFISSTISRFC